MRVLILVLCFFVLVLGSFANAQEKEAKKYFIDLVYELAKARMEGKC
jgi:hypothetical protein